MSSFGNFFDEKSSKDGFENSLFEIDILKLEFNPNYKMDATQIYLKILYGSKDVKTKVLNLSEINSCLFNEVGNDFKKEICFYKKREIQKDLY